MDAICHHKVYKGVQRLNELGDNVSKICDKDLKIKLVLMVLWRKNG